MRSLATAGRLAGDSIVSIDHAVLRPTYRHCRASSGNTHHVGVASNSVRCRPTQ